MSEKCHGVDTVVPRRTYEEFAARGGFGGRRVMNSFTLGKLAEIHIQSLVDGACGGRKVRRATSQRPTPRPKGHLHWRKKSVKRRRQVRK